MNDILFIVIPAYNEEENIENVIREWYPIIEKYNGNGSSRLVIVNDGSRDRTLQICQSLQVEMPYLQLLDKKNSGHGATVLYAYQYAINMHADYVFQTDSDGQTCPSEFEQFWGDRSDYDIIIGHRNHRKDGLSRIIVTKILKAILYMMFHQDIADANTPYRLMRAKVLAEYMTDVPEDFYLTNVLLTVLFIYNGERVKFIPITFRARRGGQNSIDLIKITKIGFCAIKDFCLIKKRLEKHDKGVRK